MIPTGLAGLISDQFYLQGIKTKDVVKLEAAKLLFPFEREILIGTAQLYYANKVLDDKTLYYFKDVLRHDPYSVQFLGAVAQLEYLNKNENEAIRIKKQLEKIAPNSNVLKVINDLMKGSK